jgi:hypothetical protein
MDETQNTLDNQEPQAPQAPAAIPKYNPRKRGGAAYPKRSGMSRRKLRAKQLAPPITQERTNALLDAALKVWSLKHGYTD